MTQCSKSISFEQVLSCAVRHRGLVHDRAVEMRAPAAHASNGEGGLMGGMRTGFAAVAVALLVLAAPASAQDYPNRQVRLVVPFPPGGINDIVARVISQHLGERLGKQVIVDNRGGAGGAGGVVGAEIVANAPKD